MKGRKEKGKGKDKRKGKRKGKGGKSRRKRRQVPKGLTLQALTTLNKRKVKCSQKEDVESMKWRTKGKGEEGEEG